MLLNRINPSVVMPGLLAPQVQTVDFEKYIGSKTNLGGISQEMLYIMTVNNINSETSVGQQWNSELTKQSYSLGQIALPYYRIQAYSEYNEDEQAKFESLVNGVSLPAFLENLAKQGINQRKHSALLVGFDDTLNQGILANATQTTLPADSKGAQEVTKYDAAELQQFLSLQARQVMDASYGMLKPVIFASSVRMINYLKTAVISLLDSANANGIDSVAGLFQRISGQWLGVGQVEFIADDTFKDMETPGSDVIVMIAPGMDSQESLPEDVNQNIIGSENSLTFNTMYDAGEGLRRLERPADFGIYSTLYTYKMTPGANLRQEAVRVINAKYE